ncbi:hypothetical protein [Nocardioides sp.]|uniref:hypothetical protein n=1 Tax=Nocardioides sp. TaxID=35761 RepID=UPI00271AF73E|nr:hypothetical protein [Nocardioides sp.]MDO9457112.1 hypothetical protein [Nocardioides sp.]
MKHVRYAAAAALTVGLVTTGASVAPAHASHGGGGDRVTHNGACEGGARWKIKAKEDDGRIEVEAEIDSNRSGQRWTWVLAHNGSRSAHGNARTAGRSGSFSVERKLVDARGADAFTFRATHGDQVCVAKVRWTA